MKDSLIRIVIMAMLLIMGNIASAKIYLVSAGIADYPGKKNDLTLPAKDAAIIAEIYSKHPGVEYKLLTNSQATCANIENAISELFSKADADDIVVFFFSGHGMKNGFVAYDKLLSYDAIRKAMAKSKSKNKMIFADACFSGKIRTTGKEDGPADAKSSNVMLFLSSRSGEVSIENKAWKNGFFTTYLQRGLRGGADKDKDRKITAKELYDYVRDGVVKASKDKQHPVMWGKFSDNMPVIVW